MAKRTGLAEIDRTRLALLLENPEFLAACARTREEKARLDESLRVCLGEGPSLRRPRTKIERIGERRQHRKNAEVSANAVRWLELVSANGLESLPVPDGARTASQAPSFVFLLASDGELWIRGDRPGLRRFLRSHRLRPENIVTPEGRIWIAVDGSLPRRETGVRVAEIVREVSAEYHWKPRAKSRRILVDREGVEPDSTFLRISVPLGIPPATLGRLVEGALKSGTSREGSRQRLKARLRRARLYSLVLVAWKQVVSRDPLSPRSWSRALEEVRKAENISIGALQKAIARHGSGTPVECDPRVRVASEALGFPCPARQKKNPRFDPLKFHGLPRGRERRESVRTVAVGGDRELTEARERQNFRGRTVHGLKSGDEAD